MKKLLSLLLALVLVFSLVACSEGTDTTDETTTETTGESVEETTETTEETTETTEETEETEETEGETAAAGEIAQIALGTSVSLSGTALAEDAGLAQEDTTIAALALDADGVIVKAHIDVAQNKVKLTNEGTLVTPAAEQEFKTKMELGPDYGMEKASGIGAEWDAQAKAFAEYIVGKTVDEVTAIPTEAKDDHPAVPTEPDLISSVTIDIGAFQKAVADAGQNTKDAAGATQLGLGVTSALGHSTAEATAEAGAAVQFETTIAVTGLDAEGKAVATLLDTAQNTVAFATDGTVAADQAAEGTTKKHLGDGYNMKKASEIGLEWFEQIEGLETFVAGKTKDEVTGLALEEGVSTDADLLATTTISIGAQQTALAESFDVVK